MSRNIFRIFNPGEAKQDPKEKRRAQLRQAQQTYRDRKDKYSKGLETELARARANETLLSKDCDRLRGLLWSALDLLARQEIELPPDLLQYVNEAQNSECQQYAPSSTELWASDSQQTPFSTLSPLLGHGCGISSPQYLDDHAGSSTGQSSEYGWSNPNSPPNAILPAKTSQMNDSDVLSMGMEFVLKIEEVCLDHIHGDVSKPHEPNWHALMATSQLIDASGLATSSKSPHGLSIPDDQSSKAILERLSSLAPMLTSEGQITPVQAWNRIRKWHYFDDFSPHAWQILISRLKATVKCHGFGAVIQTSTLEDVLSELATSERSQV